MYYPLLYVYIWHYRPKDLNLTMFFSGRGSTLSVCFTLWQVCRPELHFHFLFVTMNAVPSCGPNSPLLSASPPVNWISFYWTSTNFSFWLLLLAIWAMFISTVLLKYFTIVSNNTKNVHCLKTHTKVVTENHEYFKVWITDIWIFAWGCPPVIIFQV